MCVSVDHLNAWESSHKVLIFVILGLARNDSSVVRCSQAQKKWQSALLERNAIRKKVLTDIWHATSCKPIAKKATL